MSESNIYKKARNLKAIILVLAIVIAVLLIFIIPLFSKQPLSLTEIATNFIYNLLGVFLVVAIFEIWNHFDEQEAHDRYVMQNILSLMKMRDTESGLIAGMFNDKAVDDVMSNCLQRYCLQLADSYFWYIKNNINIYRSAFDYHVAVKFDDATSRFMLNQDLTYCRHFRTHANTHSYVFRAFFALEPGAIERLLNASHYFFREEIDDPELIARIKEDIDDKKKVMALLGFEIFLGDKLSGPIAADKIEIGAVDGGIDFMVRLTDEQYNFTPDNTEEYHRSGLGSGYIDYTARIKCRYPASNHFYCIFAEPCIQPKFSINFDTKIPISTVNRVTSLTIPPISNTASPTSGKAPLLRDIESSNIISFEPTEPITVFPRSSIYFNW